MTTAKEIYQAFHKVRQRDPEIFLDYDGTLVGIRMNPEECYADNELKEILVRLESRYRTYIVTGRSLEEMENFLRMDYNIIALHGAVFRDREGRISAVENFPAFINTCDVIYEKKGEYIERFPGLRMYNKHGGVLFHLGLVEDDTMKEQIKDAVHALGHSNGMDVYEGKMILEIRIPGINKGIAIRSIRKDGNAALIAGDDRTDEESFKYNMDAIKVKVGDGETLADFKVKNYQEIREILRNL